MSPDLRDYVAREGLEDVVRVYDDVDQADRGRLAEIVDEEFGDEPLDFVLDDCSHLYEPTRASFNELFPRLRPGGIYTIEDWRWAHALIERRVARRPLAGRGPAHQARIRAGAGPRIASAT